MFAAVSTAVLLALGLLIGNAVEQHFVEQDMELMTGKLHLVGHLLEKMRAPADLDALPAQIGNSLVGHHGLAMLVRDPGGRPLFATADASFPPSMLEPGAIRNPPLTRQWQQEGPEGTQPRRGIAALLPTAIPDRSPLLIAVAVDITHHEHFMASFRRTLWQFVAIAAALAGFLGWVARAGSPASHPPGSRRRHGKSARLPVGARFGSRRIGRTGGSPERHAGPP